MMSMHTLEPRLTRFLGELIERKLLNAGPIVMKFVTRVIPDNYDPNDEETYPLETPGSLELGGLIHIVSARTTERQFTEIKTGDAIVTFEATVDFSGKERITFEFNGDTWVQQAVGKELSQYWDLVLGGNPISQTLLLRKSA